MRLTKQQFEALVGAFWSRDADRFRAVALQIAASNNVSAEPIQRIFGRPFVASGIPAELTGMIRSIEPSDADPVLAPAVAAAIDAIVAEHRMQEELESRGLAPIRRALWHGPTGTGKTTAAALVARQLELPLLVVPMDTLVDSYLGGTSARLRKVLEHVGAEPGVVLLDEIDAIGLARGDHNDVGEQGRIVTTLLVLLDDLRRRRSRTLFIAATNRFDALDAALVRRFDQVLAFPIPTPEERVAIAAGIFLRARVPGARASFGDGVSHADVERWALATAKRQVLDDLKTMRNR